MSGPRPRAGIFDIAPYVAGKASAPGAARVFKLSANENALGASPKAAEAYREAAAELHLYPDPNATALREALGAKHGVDPARLIFGTGSDEIFSMAAIAFLEPGDNMIQPAHGFAAWAIAARAVGGLVRSAPEREGIVDVDAMLALVDARTRVVFLANPANPTGTWLPFAEIERLHAGLPGHVLLVLDEAYVEFARAVLNGPDGLRLAGWAENVLVTRTFSKLYGLAALRIGWGYGAPALIDALNRFRLPFNTPRPAQAAALAALADDGFAERSVALAEAGRLRLADALAEWGFAPLPSATNFVTARVPAGRDAGGIEAGLARRGVLLRELANYRLPDHVRVSVGTTEAMDALGIAMAAVLSTA
jgi:histidinol-phosphate aminotransferase